MDYFKGRTNRATFFMQACLVVLLYVVMVALGIRPSAASVVMFVLAFPRLHDVGRSGWSAALLFLIQFGLVVWVMASEVTIETAVAVNYVAGLIVVFGMIVLGAWPGQKVDNRFGPPPPRGIQWVPGRKKASADV